MDDSQFGVCIETAKSRHFKLIKKVFGGEKIQLNVQPHQKALKNWVPSLNYPI